MNRAWMFPMLAGCLAACHTSPPSAAAQPQEEVAAAATLQAPTLTDAGTCSDYLPVKRVYWGDLHSHTGYSVDAYAFGTRSNPYEALLFAQGRNTIDIAPAKTPAGPPTHIVQPLDFDAITDHSEWLATAYGCAVGVDGGAYDPASPYYNSAACNVVRSPTFSFGQAFAQQRTICGTLPDGGTAEESNPDCLTVTQSAWQAEQLAANTANNPCNFTALIAYEWTHATPAGATLHKNVIFGTDQVPNRPFDSLDYSSAIELWNALDVNCQADAGCDVVTIPHNSNLSQGMAFDVPQQSDGGYAVDQMVHYQRLVEVFQHKGNSECYYQNSIDPACNFEPNFDHPLLDNKPTSFVRDGLGTGLLWAQAGSTNPLQLGLVGATDTHNATPGNVAESFDGGGHWPGHIGAADDTPWLRLKNGPTKNPGGITGVWAEQNTRESIFAALKRRETYATSGTRILVRFYATFDRTNYCTGGFPGNIIAAGGMPMGSALSLQGNTTKPQLTIHAAKDTNDLAEVDIIKAVANGGTFTQTVTPISLVTGGVGAQSTCFPWVDQTYDPTKPTFYYVRVLEMPSWRWSHFDCQALGAAAGNPNDGGVDCSDAGLDTTIQERAWTSPIWFTP